MVKSLTSIRIFFFAVLVLTFIPMVYAEWTESNNYGVGNLAFYFGGTGGKYLKIPDSPYIFFFSTDDDVLIFDIDSSRIKGGKPMSHGFDQGKTAAIPDPNSGWNIYYYQQVAVNFGKFGKLHIEPDGSLGEDIWLPRTTTKAPMAIGIPEKSEVWFLTEKILILNSNDETWTELDYPQGWDSGYSSLKTYPVLAYDSIIGVSQISTTGFFQILILNVDTRISKVLASENNFFKTIKDIEEWKGHPDQYIMLNSKEVYSYNSQTDTIELLLKDFGVSASNIMQDEAGRYLYILGKPNVLFILDLEEKTVETHSISLEEEYQFSDAVYDAINRKIMSKIYVNSQKYAFVRINPDDYSVENFDAFPLPRVENWLFLQDANRLIFCSGPNIYNLDLGYGEMNSSIPVIFYTNSWNIIDDFEKPILLEESDYYYIRMMPDYRREFYRPAEDKCLVCQFPDGEKAIAGGSFSFYFEDGSYFEIPKYFDYTFQDGSFRQIYLPYNSETYIPDTKNNQIIGIGEILFRQDLTTVTTSYVVQFINPDYTVTSFVCPEDLTFYENEDYLYDEESGSLWFKYKNKDSGDWYFHKFSTALKSHVDSFILKASLEIIRSMVPDPSGKYLYFIDETNSNSKRELVVFDLYNKEIIKRFTLQEEVKYDGFYLKVIPGIFPIPEKNKLFLWDHYGTWCFDTNSWEKLYGEVKINPGASGLSLHVKGTYDNESNKIIIVDFTNDVAGGDTPYKSCLEIDPDTGTVLKEFTKPSGSNGIQFTKDKKKILFLDTYDSKINTLYLSPAWDTPASISPSTNYIQLGSGDKAKFTVNIKNPYDFEQRATAYIWMYAPDGTMLFFGPTGLTFDVTGIPITMPANCDVTGDILSFTMPAGVPEGFYNFNAVFINENGDRGPIGTWNFYVRD